MATVIDALVVSLGLDPTGFKKGKAEVDEGQKKLREDTKKTGEQFELHGKAAIEVFRKLRNEVLAVTGAIASTAAIKSFMATIADTERQTGMLAYNLGIAGDKLSLWEETAKTLVGAGGKQAMDDTFQKIVNITQQLQNMGQLANSTPLSIAFAKAGVSLQTFLSPLTDTQEKMKMLADVASRMPAPQAQNLLTQAGFSPQGITLLELGRNGLEKALEVQKRHLYLTQQDIKAGTQRAVQWRLLADDFTDIGKSVMTDINPQLTELLGKMDKWIQKNKKWIETKIVDGITAFAGTLNSIDWTAVANGMEKMAKGAERIIDTLGGPLAVAKILGGAFVGSKVGGVFGGPGRAIGAAVGAVGTGTVLLEQKEASMLGVSNTGMWDALMQRGPGGLLNYDLAHLRTMLQAATNHQSFQALYDSAHAAGINGGGATTINVTVGPTTINTQATDATGIASDHASLVIRHIQNAQSR